MTLADSWILGGVAIPDPHNSAPTAVLERGGGEERTLSGMLRVDTLWTKEQFELPLDHIDKSTYETLKGMWLDVGPYLLETPYGDRLLVKFSGNFPRSYPRLRHPYRSVSFQLKEA